MSAEPPSILRRLLASLALLVPLYVDPFGVDPLAWKRDLLALIGLTALVLEGLDAVRRRRRPAPAGTCELLLLTLAAWAALSLGWATVPALGRPLVGLLLGLVGLARLWAAMAHDGPSLSRWVAAWLLVGLAASVLDGSAVLAGAEELAAANRKYASVLFRHNNLAAGYAALLVPLAAAWALAAARPGRRRLGWAVAVALIAYLVVLRSRAGLAAALVGAGVVVLLCGLRLRLARGRPPRWGAAVTLMVAVLAVLPLSGTARGWAKDGFYRAVDVLQALGLTDLKDVGFRMDVWRGALELVAEAPLLGTGAGNFALEHVRFDPRRAEIPHAHNDALQVLSELGLPGLVLFLAFLGALVIGLRRVLAAHDHPRVFPLVAGWGGSLVVFVVHGLFETPLYNGPTAAGLCALLAWQASLDPERERRARPGRLAAGLVAVGALVLAVDLTRRLPATWHHARADLALQAGADLRAREHLTALAALGTGSHLPELGLARVSERLGDRDAALEHYDRARRLWPHSRVVLREQARSLLDAGRGERAVELLEQALALSPSDRDLVGQLVRVLASVGRLDEAIDRAEYLVQSDRDASVDIIVQLARLWLRRAEGLEGRERVRALVSARHFFALALEEGPGASQLEWAREFRHVTHELQTRVPDLGWWQEYDLMLRRRGWTYLPSAALWSGVDGEGQRLLPGWEEPAGPPTPRRLR